MTASPAALRATIGGVILGGRSMCGRYTIRFPERIKTPGQIIREIDERRERARYNIAPSQSVPVLGRDADGKDVLAPAVWGFRPHWYAADRKAPINARVETVGEKPLFRAAYRSGRCLVFADGWYEWQAQGSGPKVPHFFHRVDDQPFAFAGIAARNAEGERTMAILTTNAVGVARDVHSRMPVVLTDEASAAWLDPATKADDLSDLLQPAADEIRCYPVGRYVNRPANDDPGCIAPAA